MDLKKRFQKEKSDYYQNTVIQTNLYVCRGLRQRMGGDINCSKFD